MHMSANTYKSFAYQFFESSNQLCSIGKYENIDTILSDDTPYWIHIENPSKSLQQRISKVFDITKPIRNILFNEEASPRCIKHKDSLILILQGVNPEGEIDDSKIIRFLLTRNGLLSIGKGQLSAINDLRDDLKEHALGEHLTCFTTLVEYIISYMSDRIYKIDEMLDLMEECTDLTNEASTNLASVRQEAVHLRRFVLPQREAISQAVSKINLLQTQIPLNFSELYQMMVRQVETLRMIRERALIIQDNYSNQIGEISNRRMYVLTIIMLIFTPAFFVMSLFSMYLPLPGMNNRATWWLVILFIAVLSTGLFALFKYKKWL